MSSIVETAPLFLRGAVITLFMTILGALLAFVIAMVIGTLGTMRSPVLRAVSRVYVEIFRGVAALVLMFLMYFGISNATPFLIDPYFAGILALGLNVGAYGAEVVRAAINAIPKAQLEGTVALNMSWLQRTRYVVLPQAWAQMLPTFGNLVIELMKASAVVSLISIQDVTFVAEQQRVAMGTVLAFSSALVMYFLIARVLLTGIRHLERRSNRTLGRTVAAGGAR